MLVLEIMQSLIRFATSNDLKITNKFFRKKILISITESLRLASEVKIAMCTEAVSYTHLDVYKRQILGFVIHYTHYFFIHI